MVATCLSGGSDGGGIFLHPFVHFWPSLTLLSEIRARWGRERNGVKEEKGRSRCQGVGGLLFRKI